MKILTYITTFTSIISLSSCNLQRERQISLNSNDRVKEETVHHQQNTYNSRLDSSERRWTFWTDSWLHYHPDSGLQAQGGFLSLSELIYAKEQDKKVQQKLYQTKTTDIQVRQTEKLISKYNIRVLMYLILGIVVIYYIYRWW